MGWEVCGRMRAVEELHFLFWEMEQIPPQLGVKALGTGAWHPRVQKRLVSERTVKPTDPKHLGAR